MFYLKGNRKYLHSTDIISYIFAKYKKIKSLDIKFYKIITGNPRLKIINKKVSSIKYDCVANLDLESKRLISLIFSVTISIKFSLSSLTKLSDKSFLSLVLDFKDLGSLIK